MTELQNGEIGNQNSAMNVASPATSQVGLQQQSRTYTDQEVNDMLSSKKQKWIEKGYELARAEKPEFAQPLQSSAQNSASSANFNSSSLTEDKAREIARTEMQNYIAQQQQNAQQQQIQNAAYQFQNKLNAGKAKYADFDEVIADMNLPELPKIWLTANQFDDPKDIMYALGKDPEMLAKLRNLEHSPALLKKQMQKIADSIKQNEEAEAAKKANPPLSRQKPPTVGVDSGRDKSEYSVQDWKKIFRS